MQNYKTICPKIIFAENLAPSGVFHTGLSVLSKGMKQSIKDNHLIERTDIPGIQAEIHYTNAQSNKRTRKLTLRTVKSLTLTRISYQNVVN